MTQNTGPTPQRSYAQQFIDLAEASVDIRIHRDDRGAPQFFYRPEQLLAPVDQADALRAFLGLDANRPDAALDEDPRSFPVPQVELVQLGGSPRFDLAPDLPTLVREIRSQPATSQVTPHHVVFGAPNVMGHPDGPPHPAAPVPQPDRVVPQIPYTIGICDTGIWADADGTFAAWFDDLYDPAQAGIDGLYLPNGSTLGLEGGHGTFIAGVIQQIAPGVPFAPRVALDSNGIGDESTVAAALSQLPPEATIINLSLGCPTMNGDAIGMGAAIRALPKDTVVVAAAGNTHSTDKHYPAAMDGVVGVGATEIVDGVVRPASYSAYGDWIEVWAPGRQDSTYVRGNFVLPNTGPPVPFTVPWAEWEGTSFAAPYVAAWIAREAASSGATPREVADSLLAGSSTAGFPSGVVLP